MKINYTIIIQWSNEDNCYVVILPEWGEFCHTHGETYEEALKKRSGSFRIINRKCDRGRPKITSTSNLSKYY